MTILGHWPFSLKEHDRHFRKDAHSRCKGSRAYSPKKSDGKGQMENPASAKANGKDEEGL